MSDMYVCPYALVIPDRSSGPRSSPLGVLPPCDDAASVENSYTFPLWTTAGIRCYLELRVSTGSHLEMVMTIPPFLLTERFGRHQVHSPDETLSSLLPRVGKKNHPVTCWQNFWLLRNVRRSCVKRSLYTSADPSPKSRPPPNGENRRRSNEHSLQ